MTTSTAWQLGQQAAVRYEKILTPVILGPFADALVTFAKVQPKETVVDVGCGTGAAARYAAAQQTEAGTVIGIDLNQGMIDVANRVSAAERGSVTWRVGDAAQLPLDDASMDLVLCAQSLQFMREKAPLALAEMRRVLKANGRVALSLWSAIEENPYFHVLANAIDRHIDTETAAGLRAAFALSDSAAIANLLQTAGFGQVQISITQLELPLPDLTQWVPRHISATPMAMSFSQASATVQGRIIEDVIAELDTYRRKNQLVVPFQSHMILGSLPGRSGQV